MIRVPTLTIAVVAALLWASAHADQPEHPAPTFAAPFVPAGQKLCPAESFKRTLTPDKRALTIIRSVSSSKEGEFLAVGPNDARSRRACTIDIVLEQPLSEPRTLHMDYIGVELKEPAATVALDIRIGRQHHSIRYARGRVVENLPGTEVKRFQVRLAKGVKRLRFQVVGNARSLNRHDSALMGFDTLDLCFLGPADQTGCGSRAQATSSKPLPRPSQR